MTKMKKFMITLSALSVACLGVAIANVSPVKGAAETTLEANKSGIFMNSGASVRFDNNDTTGKKNGIRYELLITETAYANIKAGYEKATFGVLIAPASYEDTAELNYENVFGEETAVYDWAEWNSDLGKYVYNGTGDKTRIINVSTTVDFTAETVEDLKTTVIENVTYYHYYGSMTNVNENNIGREFVGVGYVQATPKAAEGAEAKKVTDTYFAEDNDNVRSMAYVAQQAIKDESKNEDGTDKVAAATKTWLQENYVDKVKTEETTYTIAYRVNSNDSGKKVIIKEEQVTATIDSEITLTTPSLEGYSCTLAENNETKVLANGKTVVYVECEYATDVKVELYGNTSKHYLYSGDVMFYVTDETKDNGIRTFNSAISGIFYNKSSDAITFNVGGGYGDAAIVDKNGVVIEGRDGQSGKLMNAENPTRAGAPSGSLAADAFAQGMVVPSGGFAIVVQQSSSYLTYGDGTTTGIRDFMHNNIISNYGNIVQISLADTETVFTNYENKAPIVTENPGVSVYKGTSLEEAKAVVIASIKYSDDNGTFKAEDNIDNGLSVTVTDTDSYAASTVGTYTFTLEIEDEAGLVTQVSTSVEVKATTFTIGYTYASGVDKSITVDEETQVCVVDGDTACPTSRGNLEYIIFTPEYTGELLYDSQYGAAIILDKYGKMKAVYDGANGMLYTSTTFTERTSLSTSDYDAAAFAAWKRNEGDYLIITANNVTGNEYRDFLLNARWEVLKGTNYVDTYVEIGMQFTLVGVNNKIVFEAKA